MSSDVRKRSRQASDVRLTNSTNWFTGFGCGAGAFAFGVGYGFIGGGGIGYGPGMPYARPTVFFGVGFGSFVGVGVGFGRMLGVDFLSPAVDWEEVILGQKSWGISQRSRKKAPVKAGKSSIAPSSNNSLAR
mmetsp:Transcript_40716/g.161384  ORF Transcript_40716/g.161384 Transcript_40716/m.161384 type:complete len:132 (+) Transcript_40716:753-1148(+)